MKIIALRCSYVLVCIYKSHEIIVCLLYTLYYLLADHSLVVILHGVLDKIIFSTFMIHINMSTTYYNMVVKGDYYDTICMYIVLRGNFIFQEIGQFLTQVCIH